MWQKSPIDRWSVTPYCAAMWKKTLAGAHKQQFPSNWKAPRCMRLRCYLAAALPSWPSVRDEPLHVSSLPLWTEPELHHRGCGFLACAPWDMLIPQIAFKKWACVRELMCVCARARMGACSRGIFSLCACMCQCRCNPVYLPPFARMNYRLGSELAATGFRTCSLLVANLRPPFCFEASRKNWNVWNPHAWT